MFDTIVQLMRALGRPSIGDDGSFSVTLPDDKVPHDLLAECEALDGSFGEYLSDSDGSGQTEVWGTFPTGGTSFFYNSLEDMLSRAPSIRRGVLPDYFYIGSLDYSSTEAPKPQKIEQLEKVVSFISLLTAFAGTGLTFEQTRDRYSLLFVISSDPKAPPRTLLMPIVVEADALENTLDQLDVLRSLGDHGDRADVHLEERRLIMRTAIADVLASDSGTTNTFTYLVKNWVDVLRRYRHNYAAYINNFSFDAVRKKIADADIEFASKLSAVLSDIAGKLLALPLSFAGLIALREATSNIAFWLGAGSLVIVSLIFSLVIFNQRIQVRRLRDSFRLFFDPLSKKRDTYPPELRSAVDQRALDHDRQSGALTRTFAIFFVLTLMPGFGALIFAVVRYSPEIHALLTAIVDALRSFLPAGSKAAPAASFCVTPLLLFSRHRPQSKTPIATDAHVSRKRPI